MNAYVSGQRKVIPAVIVYGVQSTTLPEVRPSDRILMIQRHRPDDYHYGKWNGLGGKLEPDESPLEAAVREFHEESSLDLPADRFLQKGVLQFPRFRPHQNEDWICFVFLARATAEEAQQVIPECREGRLHWVPAAQLQDLPVWEGDRLFFPDLLRAGGFTGSFWYDAEKRLERHWLQNWI